MIDFDTMLVHVGEFGLYQKILFVFQAPFCIFVTFVLFGQLFMYLYPRVYWCEDRCLNFTGFTPLQSRNLTVPFIIEDGEYHPAWTYTRSAEETLGLIDRIRQTCSQNCRGAAFCDYLESDGTCVGVGTPPLAPAGAIGGSGPGPDGDVARQKRQWAKAPWGYSGFKPSGPNPQQWPEFNSGFGQKVPNFDFGFPRKRPNLPNVKPAPYWTTTVPPASSPTSEIPPIAPVTPTTFAPEPNPEEALTVGPRIVNSPRPRPRPRPPSPPPTTASVPPSPTPGEEPRESHPVPPPSAPSETLPSTTRSNSCNGARRTNADSPPESRRNCTTGHICTSLDPTIRIVMTPRSRADPRDIRPCENWAYPHDPSGRRHPLGLPYPTVISDARWWWDPDWNIFNRATIANAVFYIGAIIGGIGIGFIADNRGRVPALVTANLLGCLGGVLTAFTASNFGLFLFCRFITGMAFDNSFTMIYILVLEYVGPTYRTLVANLSIAVFYTIGTLIVPWLAVAIEDWRYYALAISLPMLLSIPTVFVVPESARWLLSKGRTKEATRILRGFAKVNRKNVDEKIFREFEESANQLYEEITKEEDASLTEALKRPRILKNFILLTIIWSLIALIYDGHSRNILNFGDNVFISFTIASSTEFPADMLLVFTLDRIGRRWLAFASLMCAGAFSLVSAGVPQTPEMATLSLITALVSRFWVNVAFNIGLQYAAELLPTVIRAQGVNSIHIMGYVASIISPFIASLGRTNPVLSLIILGGCAIVAGVLTLFLPETLGEDLPNTLEEGEVFGKDQSFWNCPLCAKPREMEEEPAELTPVQLRYKMKASVRGETFRSSIITSRNTPGDIFNLNLNPRGDGAPNEKTRLRRGYTK